MIRRFFATGLLLALVACAPLATRRDAPAYDFIGRVLVSYDARAFSSGLRWVHRPGSEEIWLLSPLGQTLAYITDGPGGAAITGPDQQVYRASSVEALTQRALGWELPVPRLQYWVRGMAYPHSTTAWEERDSSDRLLGLKQDGWDVKLEYDITDDTRRQPRRIELRSENLRIRLVIDTWRESP